MTFTVLTVCSANTCRSPLMAGILERSLLAHPFGIHVQVTSCGVNATRGQPVCPDTARLARSNDLLWQVFERHRSAPLSDDLIAQADLILTADRQLRSDVVKRASPRSVARTFTLREAAQLAASATPDMQAEDPDERLRRRTAQLNLGRGLTGLPAVERLAALTRPWRPVAVHTHDVPDAHGDPRAPHSVVHRLVVPAAEQLIAFLASSAEAARR
jgi:protein-tyrosine-phosphatase